ncbi:MAG: ParA family protein [Euryarchaeota archaeon]|nr:ParA family protein [Euryarchaeota archaeon]
MGETIAILNQKGGCGKTTTAVNLATALALIGKRVLLIDVDPQGNATTGFGIEKNGLEHTIYTVLSEKDRIQDVVIRTNIEGLDIVPSNILLSGAEVELSKEIGREVILKNRMGGIAYNYDYVFIDVPPSLGLLTVNALVASDSVIIPIQAEYYALEGMADLMKILTLVKSRLDSSLNIKGILLTLYDKRTRLGREVYRNVKEYFGDNIFKTTIPRNVTLAEAPSHGEPCVVYDEESSGAIAYKNLAKELISMEQDV